MRIICIFNLFTLNCLLFLCQSERAQEFRSEQPRPAAFHPHPLLRPSPALQSHARPTPPPQVSPQHPPRPGPPLALPPRPSLMRGRRGAAWQILPERLHDRGAETHDPTSRGACKACRACTRQEAGECTARCSTRQTARRSPLRSPSLTTADMAARRRHLLRLTEGFSTERSSRSGTLRKDSGRRRDARRGTSHCPSGT